MANKECIIQKVKFTNNTTKLLKDLEITSFKISEGFSKLYKIHLYVSVDITKNKINSKALKELSKETIQFCISYKYNYENKFVVGEKTLSGIVENINFSVNEANKDRFSFEFILVPPLFYATYGNQYQTWNDKTTEEIITEIYKKYSTFSKIFKIEPIFKLVDKDKLLKRKNTIQNGETDFDFICRLLNEDYLTYTYVQEPESVSLVITNNVENYFKSSTSKPINLQLTRSNTVGEFLDLSYFSRSKIDNIQTAFLDNRSFDNPNSNTYPSKEANKNKVSWTNHPNYQKNSESLKLSEYYSINELNRKNNESTSLVLNRNNKFYTLGDCINFDNKLNQHLKDNLPIDLKTNFIVYEVDYEYSRKNNISNTTKDPNSSKKDTYEEEYNAKLKMYPFVKSESAYFEGAYVTNYNNINLNASAHNTTAIVFGKEIKDLKIEKKDGAIYIGIQYFWHEINEKDSKNFVWARLREIYASKDHGALFIPLPGDEVDIKYNDNDIDQPIIVGSFYNSKNKPPVDLDETKRGIVTKENLLIYVNSLDDKETFVRFNLNNEGLLDIQNKNSTIKTKEKLDISNENASISTIEKLEIKNKNASIDSSDNINIKSKGGKLESENLGVEIKSSDKISLKSSASIDINKFKAN
jgi:type VI secretion system secreted protein VgrG